MTENIIGKRKTKQRELILDTIKGAPGPLSVNEIYENLRESGNNTGIATVYRTVNLLVEKKLVNCVRLQDAIQRYEAADTAHHHHFHCEICDKVYVIKGCYLHFHNEDQKIPEGHTINSHEITFHGVCRNCKSDLSCNS